MSQSVDKFEFGKYYDGNGIVHNGLIFYDYGTPKIKFKSIENSKTKTLKPWKISGFIIDEDSFAILKEFSFEAPGGGMHKSTYDYAKVIDTGYITLYKHYMRFQRGGGPNSLITFERLENYIIEPKNSDSLITLRKKNHKKFNEQILTLFKNFPEFIKRIKEENYDWDSVPELVSEFNEFKKAP